MLNDKLNATFKLKIINDMIINHFVAFTLSPNNIKMPTGDWMVANVSKNAIKAFKKMKFNDLLFQYISNSTFIKTITYSKQK